MFSHICSWTQRICSEMSRKEVISLISVLRFYIGLWIPSKWSKLLLTQCFLSTSSSASHFRVKNGYFFDIISPSKNVVSIGYSNVRPVIFKYPHRYEFSSSTCWNDDEFQYLHYHRKNLTFSGGQTQKKFTCKTTSTAYELPFDFCEPSNFEPLYKRVFGKPNCLDCDGGGITSVRTGISFISSERW